MLPSTSKLALIVTSDSKRLEALTDKLFSTLKSLFNITAGIKVIALESSVSIVLVNKVFCITTLPEALVNTKSPLAVVIVPPPPSPTTTFPKDPPPDEELPNAPTYTAPTI